MIRSVCPCKDCIDRFVGCHGSCERFADFKGLLAERKKQKKIETMINDVCYAMTDTRMKSLKKKQVQRGMK